MPSLVGVFPDLSPDTFGGIEALGRSALAVVGRANELGFSDSAALCYGGAPTPVDGRFVAAASRLAALRAALRWRGRDGVLLLWHLGFLKLAPFFRFRGSTVVFLHGIEAWGRVDVLARRRLQRVDHFLSGSDHTWERFVAANPAFRSAPHHTVQPGLGTAFSGPTPPPREPPAVLMLGRLSRNQDYKGHREILQAWPRVLRRLPEAELWVAGDGDLRPDLERLAGRLGVAARVRFLGRVSEERKEELLLAARCLAMPSRGEGFGLVYLEAMRLGRPCLVSTLDAGREAVQPPEAGLAVEPRDERAVEDALQMLLADDTAWQRWSFKARTRYQSGFTEAHFQNRLGRRLSEAGGVTGKTTIAGA